MFDLTPFLKLYAGFRSFVLQTKDPADAQAWVLKGLIRRAEMTRFGQDHAFSSISDVRDFRMRVPLRRYEDFWREYWQPDFPRLVAVSYTHLTLPTIYSV